MGNTVSYHSSLESWGQDAQGHGRRHTSNMDVMVEKEKGPFVADRSEQEPGSIETEMPRWEGGVDRII